MTSGPDAREHDPEPTVHRDEPNTPAVGCVAAPAVGVEMRRLRAGGRYANAPMFAASGGQRVSPTSPSSVSIVGRNINCRNKNGVLVSAAGQHYIRPALSSYLVSRTRRMEKLAGAAPGIETLTPAERNVAEAARGVQDDEGDCRHPVRQPRTVDHHRANIATKLDLRGSYALTRFAVENRSVISE
jgi:hypothetical protein